MANETTAAATKPGLFNTVSSWMNEVGQLFNTGLGLYTAANQRLEALESIKEDTVQAKTAAPATINSGAKQMPDWVMPVAAGVGVLLLILIVRKLR